MSNLPGYKADAFAGGRPVVMDVEEEDDDEDLPIQRGGAGSNSGGMRPRQIVVDEDVE